MSKNNPLVSVIMPSYNRSKRIPKAIESVINQTYKTWELIIVDDNSSDDTADVVESYRKFESRIKYLKLEKNRGASGARNIGMLNSRGDYITFLDSDDEYFPMKIENQLNLFILTDNKNLGVVSCGAIDFKEGKEYNRRLPIKRDDYYTSLLSKKKRIGAGTPFLMVKADLIHEKKIYFDEDLLAMEDWDFVLRIVKESQFDFVKDYLVKVNHHNDERLYTSSRASEALTRQYEKYKTWLSVKPQAHRGFVTNAAVLKAHHSSIKESIDFLVCVQGDFMRLRDKCFVIFFKYFIYTFYFKPVKSFYLKYLK